MIFKDREIAWNWTTLHKNEKSYFPGKSVDSFKQNEMNTISNWKLDSKLDMI